MYRLFFLSGAHKGRRMVIRQGPVILGRHPDSAIQLPDDGVALQHAILEDSPEGGVRIRCLAPDARLAVNRQEVSAVELQDGDQIEVGPVRLQFQSQTKAVAAGRARHGGLQSITLAAVGLLLLGQLGFLVWLSVWQYGHDGLVSEQVALQTPAPLPAPDVAVNVQPEAPPPPPAVTAAVAATSGGSGEVASAASEIKRMQEEVNQLRHEVAALPPPTPPPPAPAPATAEAEHPVWELAQRMLKRALAQAADLGPAGLDQELEKIQLMAPDFPPAYLERARQFEQRRLPREALAQWQALQRHTAQADWLARAQAEIESLAALNPPPAPAPATEAPAISKYLPLPQPVAAARAPLVRIAALDQQKFLTNDQFDEMRVLRITLASITNAPPADPADVTTRVTFYDQDRDTGRIAPTRAVAPHAVLHLAEAAKLEAQPVLTAAYLLPRGFRDKETRTQGSRRRYYGYRVQVYYGGELQDEKAHPTDLLAPDVLP